MLFYSLLSNDSQTKRNIAAKPANRSQVDIYNIKLKSTPYNKYNYRHTEAILFQYCLYLADFDRRL